MVIRIKLIDHVQRDHIYGEDDFEFNGPVKAETWSKFRYRNLDYHLIGVEETGVNALSAFVSPMTMNPIDMRA